MRFTKQSWILLVVVAFLFVGCKKGEEKKGEENKKAKVEKKEPAANEPAADKEKGAPETAESTKEPIAEMATEEPAVEAEDVVEAPHEAEKAPVNAEEPDVIPGDAVVGKEAPTEAAKEAPAEATKEAPATEGEPAVEEGEEGEAEEEPVAPEGEEEGAVEAGGDVVAEVVEEENPHFGREFKLDAIMLISELVKQPEYYSSFDSLKVRAPVVAQQGNLALLEMKTQEGTTFYICARMDVSPKGGISVGDVIYVEGKLVKEGWEPGALGKGELGNTESNSFNTDWLFTVEAGEPSP